MTCNSKLTPATLKCYIDHNADNVNKSEMVDYQKKKDRDQPIHSLK